MEEKDRWEERLQEGIRLGTHAKSKLAEGLAKTGLECHICRIRRGRSQDNCSTQGWLMEMDGEEGAAGIEVPLGHSGKVLKDNCLGGLVSVKDLSFIPQNRSELPYKSLSNE